MRRALALAGVAALLAAPAAAAPGKPRLWEFETVDRLLLVVDTALPPTDEPQLRDAIALALDRNALARTSTAAATVAVPLAPRYLTPAALARARALAAPWAGTHLTMLIRRRAPPVIGPRLDALRFELAQIGLVLDVVREPPVAFPEYRPPPSNLAFVRLHPDYPSQPSADLLRWTFPSFEAIPLARLRARIFFSGRVARVVYNRVFGVDLAALELR